MKSSTGQQGQRLDSIAKIADLFEPSVMMTAIEEYDKYVLRNNGVIHDIVSIQMTRIEDNGELSETRSYEQWQEPTVDPETGEVWFTPLKCECDDCQYRKRWCKHAALFLMRRRFLSRDAAEERATTIEVDPETGDIVDGEAVECNAHDLKSTTPKEHSEMAIHPDRLVIFGPSRLSWMSVYEPRNKKQRDGTLRQQYEVTLLIPKKSANHPRYVEGELDKVKRGIEAAIADMFGEGEVQKLMRAPQNLFKNCLKDGDKELVDDGKGNYVPRHPGFWYMNATAKPDKPPRLFNAYDGSVSKKSDGWVSGDWAKAQVFFYAFDNEGKGVGCGLRALQFCFKDEPFGGGAQVATADDFGKIAGADAPVPSGSGYDAPGDEYAPPQRQNSGCADDELDDPFADS